MADSTPAPPTTEQKTLKLLTHQAQNLETIRLAAEQFDLGPVEGALSAIEAELQGVNRKLWHVVLWLYILIVLIALPVVASGLLAILSVR